MGKNIPRLALSVEQCKELEWLARRPAAPQEIAVRARIILGAAAGASSAQLARELHTSVTTVLKWLRRWDMAVLQTIGMYRSLPGASDLEGTSIVETALCRKPPAPARRNVRSIFATADFSRTSARKVPATYGVQFDGLERSIFKIGENFARHLCDIAGLYMGVPNHALVASTYPESESLDAGEARTVRTEMDDMRPVRADSEESDRVSVLMAALGLLDKIVLDRRLPYLYDESFLHFLDQARAAVPPELDVHIVLDCYRFCGHGTLPAWLAQHPRCHLHLTSTSQPWAWLEQVEDCLDRIRLLPMPPGAFSRVPEVLKALRAYATQGGQAPHAFVWVASPYEAPARSQQLLLPMAAGQSTRSGERPPTL